MLLLNNGAHVKADQFIVGRVSSETKARLRERAAGRGMPPATYVSVLTRAHLRSLAPLPAEELVALKRTLGELGSIGRNLNQIARAANQGQLVTSPGRDDLRQCSASVGRFAIA